MNKKGKNIIKILLKIGLIVILILIISNKYKEADYNKLPRNTYCYNIMNAEEQYRLANIKKFVKTIQEVKYEEAYNLLSDKCKEEKFHNNIEAFKNFVKTYLIDYNKPEKTIYYEIIPENESSTNIKVIFTIKNVNDYYDAPEDEESLKYYKRNVLDVIIEEKSLMDYKYYIDLNVGYK